MLNTSQDLPSEFYIIIPDFILVPHKSGISKSMVYLIAKTIPRARMKVQPY